MEVLSTNIVFKATAQISLFEFQTFILNCLPTLSLEGFTVGLSNRATSEIELLIFTLFFSLSCANNDASFINLAAEAGKLEISLSSHIKLPPKSIRSTPK